MKISSLTRLHVTDKIFPGQQITLSLEQTHYLVNVMRLKINSMIRVFNEESGEFNAKIINLTKKNCLLETHESLRGTIKIPHLCLVMSIIKNDRMIEALSMATQLGVTEIIPVITQRTQCKTINYERTERILIESSEQSERMSVPKLHKTRSLKDFLSESDFESLYFANENQNRINAFINRSNLKTHVLIGPEGGFTDQEMEILISDSKVRSVSLGNNVLRSETACAALISLIKLS